MPELKDCPFCGCEMRIFVGNYPNGDKKIEPQGLHTSDCPLDCVSWHTYPEEGWTEENLANAWNMRDGE